MDQSAFTPSGSNYEQQTSASGMDGGDTGMTPISRLIPYNSSSSGNGGNYSEKQPTRVGNQGGGGAPPMAPPQSTRDDGNSADVVSEILRDVESGSSVYQGQTNDDVNYTAQLQYANQSDTNNNAPHQPSTVRFNDTPKVSYNEGAEEHPSMMSVPQHTHTDMQYTMPRDSYEGYSARSPTNNSPTLDNGSSSFIQDDFVDTIMKETRLPLIVAGLILLSGLSNADDVLSKILPALVIDGSIGYAGLIVKSILGGLLFYAILKIFM